MSAALSFVALPIAVASLAKLASQPAKTLNFELHEHALCESGYTADDLSTPQLEETCVAFDLSNREASAFQEGVSILPVKGVKALREVWPLNSIQLNTDPRELPNPAVSPLIYFRFHQDKGCPSGYAGKLLNDTSTYSGACLVFSLDGYRGEGEIEAGSELSPWQIKKIQFKVESDPSVFSDAIAE